MGRFALMFLIFDVWFPSLSHTKSTWKRLRIAIFDVCVLKNLLASILTVYFFSSRLFLTTLLLSP